VSEPRDPPRPAPPGAPWSALVQRGRELATGQRVRAGALLVVAGLAGFVWFHLGRGGDDSTAIRGPAVAASTPTTSTTRAPREVLVHVAGAVAHPGLVRLRDGARVADALAAAGGGLADADLDRLNLAAPVGDGQRVAVARVGQPAPVATATGPGSGEAGSTSGPIDLNTATQAELETLPGIGPTLATAILTTRDRLGGFTDVAQLREVRGIGEMRFADLRDLVTV